KLTQTTLRNVIGEMELDHVLSSRDTINAKLRAILDDATHKWGAKVSRVELKDINPPRDIRDAMEKQMRAERDRRATILTAEADKQSLILKAEGTRQSEINQAEGDKQAKILHAEAEAAARLMVAEAEAKAIERIAGAVQASGGDPARYLIAIRYIEALREMVTGPQDNNVVYLPQEASGVLSSLGAIREMLSTTRVVREEPEANDQREGHRGRDRLGGRPTASPHRPTLPNADTRSPR
ncbi:MAG: SPFH domain-containing protein, partial [Gemmatimonadales bacterium]